MKANMLDRSWSDEKRGYNTMSSNTAYSGEIGRGPTIRSSGDSDSQIAEGLASISADLQAHVLDRWRAYFPARASASPPDVQLTVRHFGFSVLFEGMLTFPADARPERFMVKVRRNQRYGSIVPDDVNDRTLLLARKEYDEHVRAYQFFLNAPAELSVVRPIDYIERYHAFVVEHAAGRDLSKIVRSGEPIAVRSLERCGAWWRAFHDDLQQAQRCAWTADRLDRRLARRLERLRAIGAPVSLIAQLERDARAVARRVGPCQVPVSVIHGDCKLRHVWASPTGIQVLDFGNTKKGDSWMDPASLIAELSLYSLWSPRLHTASHLALMQAVVAGYFGDHPPAAFWLYVADSLFKKWHRRLRNWGPGPGMMRIRRSLKRVRLDAPVERLYIDRWFATQIRAWLALADGQPPDWLKPLAP